MHTPKTNPATPYRKGEKPRFFRGRRGKGAAFCPSRPVPTPCTWAVARAQLLRPNARLTRAAIGNMTSVSRARPIQPAEFALGGPLGVRRLQALAIAAAVGPSISSMGCSNPIGIAHRSFSSPVRSQVMSGTSTFRRKSISRRSIGLAVFFAARSARLAKRGARQRWRRRPPCRSGASRC